MRNCLLSKAYTGAPAIMDGVELIYCAVANDINQEMLSENKVADTTDFFAVVQCIFIMLCLGKNDPASLHAYRALPPPERVASLRGFMIDHSDVLAEITPLIIAKMESAFAASVESEAGGKSHAPLQASLP